MDNLSDLITTLYPADCAVKESVKIANDLSHLSMGELAELAGVGGPTMAEKRAYAAVIQSYGDDDKSWLEQFEGTPLAQAAIALCEQELDMRAKHLQKRIERRRRDDYDDEWTERDQLCLQKKRLELALHKHKAALTAPAPQAATPQTGTSALGAGMMGHNEKTSMLKLAVSRKWIIDKVRKASRDAVIKARNRIHGRQPKGLFKEKYPLRLLDPKADSRTIVKQMNKRDAYKKAVNFKSIYPTDKHGDLARMSREAGKTAALMKLAVSRKWITKMVRSGVRKSPEKAKAFAQRQAKREKGLGEEVMHLYRRYRKGKPAGADPVHSIVSKAHSAHMRSVAGKAAKTAALMHNSHYTSLLEKLAKRTKKTHQKSLLRRLYESEGAQMGLQGIGGAGAGAVIGGKSTGGARGAALGALLGGGAGTVSGYLTAKANKAGYKGIDHLRGSEGVNKKSAVQQASEKKASEKVAVIGPLIDAGNLGIPSAIGYAIGNATTPGSRAAAERESKKRYGIGKALLIPGYTGYHHGSKSKAQDVLRGMKERDRKGKSKKSSLEKQAFAASRRVRSRGMVKMMHDAHYTALLEKLARIGAVVKGLRGAAGMEARAARMAAASKARQAAGKIVKRVAKPPPIPAMTAGGKPMIRRLKPSQMSAGGQKMRQMTQKALAGAESKGLQALRAMA